MKIIINTCYGGFGLSPLAVKEIAKRKGRDCYFFTHGYPDNGYVQISAEKAHSAFIWFAYSVPNPNDYKLSEPDQDGLYRSANERADKIALDYYLGEYRADPDVIAVVEQLGDLANGKYAQLKIIEIPDDIEWEIDEYDGIESVHEKHRTWD